MYNNNYSKLDENNGGYGYQQQVPPPYQPQYQAQPPPQYSQPAQDDGKFNASPSYRDPFWALLFWLHLVGMVVLCIAGSLHFKNNTNTNQDEVTISTSDLNNLIGITFATIAAAVLYNIAYLSLVKKFARALIIFTLIMSCVFALGFAVFLLASGNIIGGVIFLFFALLHILFYYWWRNRIPFATAVLTTVAGILQDYPATTYTAYLSILVHIAYVVFFSWTVVVSQQYVNSKYLYPISVFLIFSYYWTSQVIKNVVHVTVSGMTATWYFLKTSMPSNPTAKAFKRSMTTSFGSICLGSLLVALLETLRTIIRGVRNDKSQIVRMILDCLLGIIESLLRYFNFYAFTQVAIYGKTYCQAARDTWELIHSHGCEAIINDNLISNVLSMGAVLGAILCAILGGVLSALFVHDYIVLCVVIGAIIGFTISIVCMEVVQSGVASTFVCFAMDREALRRSDPFLYDKFVSTYNIY